MPFPEGSDTGVGYPQAIEQADGTVLIMTGQGKGRWKTVILHPAWLLERSQTADFTTTAAASRWNNSVDTTGTYVSTCTVAHEWADMLAGGRLVYCPYCAPAVARSAYWQPTGSRTVHPIAANASLGCGTGYCGIPYFSPCGTALPLPVRDFGQMIIGDPFECRMLPAQPQTPPPKTCANANGAALRKPQLTPPTTSNHTALCVDLGMGPYPVSPTFPGMRQATAQWNFPSGPSGSLTMSVALETPLDSNHSAANSTFGGAVIALSDHASIAWDDRQLPSVSLFALTIDTDGHIGNRSGGTTKAAHSGDATEGVTRTDATRAVLPFGQWLTLTMNWTLFDGGKTGRMTWAVAETGGASGSAPLLNAANEGAVSYWSVQSRGAGGMCVRSITVQSADGSPVE